MVESYGMNSHTAPPYKRKTKVTVLIRGAVYDEVRKAVEAGHAASQSALVEEAVTEYLARRKHAVLRNEYRHAASDPAFLADIDEVMQDFERADAEVDPA